MEIEKIEAFTFVGLAVRTTNENGQAAKDIPLLWNRFMSENIIAQIPDMVDGQICCMYTHYEGDFTKPYTTIIGCKVKNSSTHIPQGLVLKQVPAGNCAKMTVKGNINEGIVYEAWTKIWSSGLDRAYGADFEVYEFDAQNPALASIDIFVSVKE